MHKAEERQSFTPQSNHFQFQVSGFMQTFFKNHLNILSLMIQIMIMRRGMVLYGKCYFHRGLSTRPCLVLKPSVCEITAKHSFS